MDLRTHSSASIHAIAQYHKMIQKSWPEADPEFLRTLLELMLKRVAAVIAANGGATKY